MAELEIHTETEGALDTRGQKIGLLAATMAVALGVVTISSHRAHTAGVLLKAEANDRWSFYQSKRIKYHSLELGADLIATLAPKDDATRQKLENYRKEEERYDRDSKEVSEEARHKEHAAELNEQRALRFDFGEGMLEIGVVLTSLYFMSRRMLFPGIGIVVGVIGAVSALTAWIM
jgi:hypothetical protein